MQSNHSPYQVAAIENGLNDSLIPSRPNGAQERLGYSPKVSKMSTPNSGKAGRSSGKRARLSKQFISWEPQLDDAFNDGGYEEDEPSTSQLKVSRQQLNARHSALFAALDEGCADFASHGSSGRKRTGKGDHSSSPLTGISMGEDVSSCEDGDMSLLRVNSLRDIK